MKYIAFFDTNQNENQDRYYSLSATNKIAYICSAINGQGIPVEIISPSWTKRSYGYYRGIRYAINENTQVKLFDSFGAANKFCKMISYFYSMLQFFIYSMINIKSGESILVYHSTVLIPWIILLQKIRKFRLLLEVEEIYGEVRNCKNTIQQELFFFRMANGYLFPTELLNDQINTLGKPHAIIYGSYHIDSDQKCKRNDGKIHCVYAGTFDPRKGGIKAAAAAEFLDEHYHIHIIGFGTESDKHNLLSTISEVSKKTKCTVTFDGSFCGDEYIRYIQSCDIGLCTQNLNASFNESSFPSKVLSYLSNGLRVISIRIRALELSEIHSLLCYYEEDSPEAIAMAINSIPVNTSYDSRTRIMALDSCFCADIKRLI